MTFWFSTPTGYGETEEADNVPPGATFITEAAYDAAIAAQQATLNAGYAAAITQRKTDYTTVYAALRSMGMPVAAATILAKGIGQTPDVDPELNVKPMSFFSAPVTFTHALAGASGAFEKITEVADVTVTESGLYEVSWSIFGSVNIPAMPSGGTQTTGITFGAVYKNGVKIDGTECVPASLLEGNSGGAQTEPILQIQATAAGAQPLSLNAGDVLSIYGGRAFSGGLAPTHSIISNTNGRTGLSAIRIRPA